MADGFAGFREADSRALSHCSQLCQKGRCCEETVLPRDRISTGYASRERSRADRVRRGGRDAVRVGCRRSRFIGRQRLAETEETDAVEGVERHVDTAGLRRVRRPAGETSGQQGSITSIRKKHFFMSDDSSELALVWLNSAQHWIGKNETRVKVALRRVAWA